MSLVLACALVAVVRQWPTPQTQQMLPPTPIVSHNITLLREWVSAAHRHVPGESDAAFLAVAAWSRDDAESVWVDSQALFALVRNPKASNFFIQPSGQSRSFRAFMSAGDLEVMRRLAGDLRSSIDTFVKRAAVLHSDIARESERNLESPRTPSMFSPNRFVLQTDDGERKGLNGGIVHWEFARLLLDQVPGVARDDFVRAWYRASLAFKLLREELDTPHFAHAIRIFPNDAVIRFLKGCLHDAFAHPAVQTVVDSARLPAGLRLDVRSEAAELREAEGEFRRAIELDPTFAEARLRRGRVLTRQGKHGDALMELQQALPMLREPMLAYFARLFHAAAEEALGRFTNAHASYEEAARLYPHAQAPHVGLSQLAHRGGNRAAAREALRVVFEQSSQIDLDDDPWWTYQRSAGRMADEWREATYRALPR